MSNAEFSWKGICVREKLLILQRIPVVRQSWRKGFKIICEKTQDTTQWTQQFSNIPQEAVLPKCILSRRKKYFSQNFS
jgi:hypothetical protein